MCACVCVRGEGERQVVSLHTHKHTRTHNSLSGCLGYGQLGLLGTTKHEETQQKSCSAGRQVVNGGRNCYLSHRQEQRNERSQECACGREEFIPSQLFSISTIKTLLLQFPRRFGVSRGTPVVGCFASFSHRVCDFSKTLMEQLVM